MFDEFYRGSCGIGCLNSAFLALIPKKEGAQVVGDFRPISLVNGAYKMVAMVLANRLKPTSGFMIEENQSAFIPGWILHDGFMVAQELISTPHRDKQSGVVIKLDFSKAYDNVRWDFLLHLLACHGLRINFHKNSMLGIHVDERKLAILAGIFGCRVQHFPTRLLGLPLHLGKLRKVDWNPLVDKLERRLEGWKGKILRIGGRLVLLQAVLSYLPVFFLSIFKVPEGILQKLEGIRCRFYSSGTHGDSRKSHMVCWDLVCCMKRMGGAGVLNLGDFNKALLSKWRWMSNRDLLWCRLLEVRFRCGDPRNHFPVVSPRISFTWRNILSYTEGFMDAIFWRVGDGCSTSFWHDVWLGDCALKERFTELFKLSRDRDGTVANHWCPGAPHGVWNIRLQRNSGGAAADLLPDLLRELYSVVLVDSVSDLVFWRPQPRLTFTTRGYYDWWCRDRPVFEATASKALEIWKPKIPLKVHIFLWKMYQERLLTKVYRGKWASVEGSTCSLCEAGEETLIHLFLECTVGRELWRRLKELTGMEDNNLTLNALWEAGKKLRRKEDRSAAGKISQSFIPVVSWTIWLARNHRIFRGSRVYMENLWESVLNYIKTWGIVCAGASRVMYIGRKIKIEE
ncbi:hypothetical protein QJS04_geneDACA016871 [Acorus gramineus]|uniref:Reverse transcriptase n=1 Tax=Acorus gramineus TaxID=55184 RepID=A0AAV9BLB4_ACOGR|nr:hypothetical protein QJS04_geneDACA016871 [Acorus gramineus]